MSTLAQAFLLHVKALFSILFYISVTGIFISRFYIFYEVYTAESVKKREDAWLRVQCKNPEFYSNLRQHTDLCTQVEQHARSWIFLTALNAMAMRNQWCGSQKSCAEYFHQLVVQGFAWPMVACFALALIALPHIIAARAKQAMAQMLFHRNAGHNISYPSCSYPCSYPCSSNSHPINQLILEDLQQIQDLQPLSSFQHTAPALPCPSSYYYQASHGKQYDICEEEAMPLSSAYLSASKKKGGIQKKREYWQ